MIFTIIEKQELVYNTYMNCLDLDIAFLKNSIDEDDKRQILNDRGFQKRIEIYDAMVKEELIVDLRHLSKHGETGSVRLTAIKKLGEMFYTKKFVEPENDNRRGQVPDKIILCGSDE